MNRNVSVWLHGLLAAFIGGGASAVVGGITVSAIDPAHFNFAGELIPTLKIMTALFIVNGVLSTFAYLKQSPLPAESVELTQTTTTKVTATPTDTKGN